MTRIFGTLIAVLFLSVGQIASAQDGELLKRAQAGDATAQNELGNFYHNLAWPLFFDFIFGDDVDGDGVEQDYAEAVKWWKRSAEQGNASAQNNLGRSYQFGNGVDQDHAEAVKWWRLAAEQGSADAQHNLGRSYYFGVGIEQDYAEAVKWYRLAAEQGDAGAQHRLGVTYYEGEGTLKDLVYSHMWFNIAASLGGGGAGTERDAIAEEMTPEQIAEAQKLARECVRKEYKDC